MSPQSQLKTKIAVVDDHELFRKGLIALINMFENTYTVMFEASNGLDFQKKISFNNLPDIALVDINMPGANGFETVGWINKHCPGINVLVISMIEKEETIIRMLKLGVKGYLSKDIEPSELKKAMDAITTHGYYYTDFITGKLIHSILRDNGNDVELSNREREFLQFSCTELTYKEIAEKMFLSPRTIDGYREALFEKLGAKSRTGLALYAVRNGMVTL